MKEVLADSELEIQEVKIKEAALVLRAINSKLRRKLLSFIHQNKCTSVMPIYKRLKLEQSVTSMHLKILRDAGIVIAEKRGKSVYYSVNYKRLEKVGEIGGQLLRFEIVDAFHVKRQ